MLQQAGPFPLLTRLVLLLQDLGPSLKKASNVRIMKVDIDEHPQLATKYRVQVGKLPGVRVTSNSRAQACTSALVLASSSSAAPCQEWQ